MKVVEIYSYLNRLYKFDNQAEWDNSTLINNCPQSEVNNIIVCLDINKRVLQLAIENKAQLIISHHPLFTNPPTVENYHVRRISGYLKKYQISTIFLHTPFDRSIYGMNTSLAYKLGLKNIKQPENSNDYILGDLPETMSIGKLAHLVKEKFGSDCVKYPLGYKTKQVNRVAICGGSGSSLIYELKGADVFITGDVKHHAWIDSLDLKIPIIDINHNVENIFVDVIADKLLKFNDFFNVIKIKATINFKFIL